MGRRGGLHFLSHSSWFYGHFTIDNASVYVYLLHWYLLTSLILMCCFRSHSRIYAITLFCHDCHVIHVSTFTNTYLIEPSCHLQLSARSYMIPGRLDVSGESRNGHDHIHAQVLS